MVLVLAKHQVGQLREALQGLPAAMMQQSAIVAGGVDLIRTRKHPGF
jgi:hypothetical protein